MPSRRLRDDSELKWKRNSVYAEGEGNTAAGRTLDPGQRAASGVTASSTCFSAPQEAPGRDRRSRAAVPEGLRTDFRAREAVGPYVVQGRCRRRRSRCLRTSRAGRAPSQAPGRGREAVRVAGAASEPEQTAWPPALTPFRKGNVAWAARFVIGAPQSLRLKSNSVCFSLCCPPSQLW